jgi:riboflavin synthase
VFTGIIEAIGTVRRLTRQGAGGRVEIAAAVADGLRLGESIAVDGACLTVAAQSAGGFTADLSAETLSRTTIGRLRAGERVNLERPLRVGDRLGGHLLTGHVDAVGPLLQRSVQGEGAVVRFKFPAALAALVVEKGSIAVDGISLTVAAVGTDFVDVALIPVTLQGTTLGEKRVGASVNLEMDLIGKYVRRLGQERPALSGREVTWALLKENGFA